MKNRLESAKKALEEIKRREHVRVDKQQSLGNFEIKKVKKMERFSQAAFE